MFHRAQRRPGERTDGTLHNGSVATTPPPPLLPPPVHAPTAHARLAALQGHRPHPVVGGLAQTFRGHGPPCPRGSQHSKGAIPIWQWVASRRRSAVHGPPCPRGSQHSKGTVLIR